MALSFYVDLDRRTIVKNGTTTDTAAPTIAFGEIHSLSVIFQSGGSAVDKSLSTLSVGLGLLAEKPTIGTFALSYSGQTTAVIACGATAAVVQAALVALPNILSGQVSVTGDAGGPWTIEFTGTLAKTDVATITADGDNLYPTSYVVILVAKEGSATANEIQEISLEQQPCCYLASLTPGGATPWAFTGIMLFDTGALKRAVGAGVADDLYWEFKLVGAGGTPRDKILVKSPTISDAVIEEALTDVVIPNWVNPLYLNSDYLTKIYYNSATHKMEFWVEDVLVGTMP